MTAQILKFTMLPDVDPDTFEQTLKDKVSKIEILRRTVEATSSRLFKSENSGPDQTYIGLVFTKMVGSTPETAGEGAVILCELPLPIANIAGELANLATVEILSELPLPPD
jgi:hypothetical protein